jgi:large subunit ribosomal protein L17
LHYNEVKKNRKLSRKRDQRRALLKGLAANLILKEKIKTTEVKAKEVRPLVERLITKAKKGDFNSARYVAKILPAKAVARLIKEVAPRYANRPGGYTRIIKIASRRGDGVGVAIIELV